MTYATRNQMEAMLHTYGGLDYDVLNELPDEVIEYIYNIEDFFLFEKECKKIHDLFYSLF